MNLLDLYDEKIDQSQFDRQENARLIDAEEVAKRVKLDTFKDVLPSLLTNKKQVLDSDNEKDYLPFTVNRMMSYQPDCLFYANEMNMNHKLDKRLQYDFYFYAIKQKYRPFTPWIKPKKMEDLEAIQTYYGYSKSKAQAVINILTESQLAMIRQAIKTD